jgi:hypothetical protein
LPATQLIRDAAVSYCFYKCIETVSNIIRFMRPGDLVVMFFDKGTEDRSGEFADHLRMQKAPFPQVAGISFAPVKEVIPLQGADMIAYEASCSGRTGWSMGKPQWLMRISRNM